jgi:hypothetical protein
MDHIDRALTMASRNKDNLKSIRTGVSLAQDTLNRYYSRTDQSEVYRIAMGTLHAIPFSRPGNYAEFQCFIHGISFHTSRPLSGKMNGSKPLNVLSEMSSLART